MITYSNDKKKIYIYILERLNKLNSQTRINVK